MNIVNYQKHLDSVIESIKETNNIPTLLLHSCCAPCSSYVLEYLSEYFKITIYFYNPNIYPEQEYDRRLQEQIDLISKLNTIHPIQLIKGDFIPDEFYAIAKGFEQEKEGSERCFRCYELRLRHAAIVARENNFDYFTTTLSISPHKNATVLNEIGKQLSEEYGVAYLYSDFKKKNGYKRSIQLSKEYDLYRQDYCGCVYSKNNKKNEF